MRHRTVTILLAAVALASRAGADSGKPGSAPPSAAVPAAAARIPVATKYRTAVSLRSVKAYLGTNAILIAHVDLSGSPAPTPTPAPAPAAGSQPGSGLPQAPNLGSLLPKTRSCRFEVRFPGLPERAQDATCTANPAGGYQAEVWLSLPDGFAPGSGAASLRVAENAELYASPWTSAPVEVHRGRTRIDVTSSGAPLPPNLAAVQDVMAASSVTLRLVKLEPDGPGAWAVGGRTVSVALQGGNVAGAVPPSNANGEVALLVIHEKAIRPVLKATFAGDATFEPSAATANLK